MSRENSKYYTGGRADLDAAYWHGTKDKKPKNTEELVKQINNAILAVRQWTDAAESLNTEDSVMIGAQIYWLERLIKLAKIELKK